MGYDKTTWVEGVAPGISAANLNNLETQYDEAVAVSVLKSLYDAYTILFADSDNTPAALTIAASRLIGRKATGGIAALTGAQILAILNGQAGANFSMNSKKITSLLNPTADQDADTKKARVDAVAALIATEVTDRNNAIATHAALTSHLVSGLIVMWHGTIGNIPSGWVICDGGSGTPNLLAKFVQGVATAGTNPGTTGGATNKTTAGHRHLGAWTQGDSFTAGAEWLSAYGYRQLGYVTDTISDIRPLFYDIAYIMKT